MTRHLARLLAPLLIAAGLVLGTSVASQAHDNAVHLTPVCNHDTGLIDLTETVTNDYNLTEVLSNATRSQSQLNGHTVAKNGSITATESVNPGSGTITLTVHGKWSDGFQKDSTGSTVVPGSCQKTQHVTVSATFADQTCDGKTGVFTPGTYSAPAVDGTDVSTSGDTNPGDTLTVTFTPHQYVVIDGSNSFSHTYPAQPTTCHKPPPPPCGVCHLAFVKHLAGHHTVHGNLACDGVHDRLVVTGNVTVKRGHFCILTNSYVDGNVKSHGADEIRLANTTVRGDVRTHNVGMVADTSFGNSCGKLDPSIGGRLVVSGHGGFLGCELTVCKSITLDGLDGRIMLKDSVVRRGAITVKNLRPYPGHTAHYAPARVYHNHAGKGLVLRHNHRQVIVRR